MTSSSVLDTFDIVVAVAATPVLSAKAETGVGVALGGVKGGVGISNCDRYQEIDDWEERVARTGTGDDVGFTWIQGVLSTFFAEGFTIIGLYGPISAVTEV